MPLPMTYRQIADDIAARIASGEYQPGQELPSYSQLAELYSVGRTTAARVYSFCMIAAWLSVPRVAAFSWPRVNDRCRPGGLSGNVGFGRLELLLRMNWAE